MDAKEKYARSKSLRTCHKRTLSPTSTKRMRRIALKDTINAEILAHMKTVFDRADVDGGGFLDMDEFVDAFSGAYPQPSNAFLPHWWTLSTGILSTSDGSDEFALRKLFMRVDVNADNVLDWNEFLTYMLLDKEKSHQEDHNRLERKMCISMMQPNIPEKNMHRELITCITQVPPGAGNLYISSSQDGEIIAWNAKDMSVWKCLNHESSWITCTAYLSLTKKLAVASFHRSIQIYDCPNLYVNGCIRDLPYTPLCLAAWRPVNCRNVEILCLGDIKGNVLLYEVKTILSERKNPDQFNYQLRWQKKVHEDMVTTVTYIEELDCIISSSMDHTVAIIDTELRTSVKKLIGHTKGVNTCAWSSFYKFICTGGQDRRVILWNPFSQKPLTSLLGHGAPIISIAVHDLHNTLISLSSDKCIKIWDIRNHSCLQTIFDKERYHPNNTLTTMLFDKSEERLLCGNRCIKAWDMKVNHHAQNQYHDQSIRAILYNPVFHEVLSADIKGTICVWKLEDFSFRLKFIRAHGEAILTSMTMDPNYRRLLTTSEDGSCKMWNFSNGNCLKTFRAESKSELTNVLCLKMHGKVKVITAGWDQKVTVFDDDDMRDIVPFASFTGHAGDVVSLAAADTLHLIASVDCKGTIFVWNTDTWTIKQRLDGTNCISTKPTVIIKISFLQKKWKHILLSLHEDGMLGAWNACEGSLLTHCLTKKHPSTIAVNSELPLIAVGSEHGSIQIMEYAENQILEKLAWFVGDTMVTCMDWVPLSHHSLVIGCLNSMIQLWSLEGICLGTFCQAYTPLRHAIDQHLIPSNHRAKGFIEEGANSSDEDIPVSLWETDFTKSR